MHPFTTARRRRSARRLVALATVMAATSGALATGATPAHAAACPDPVFVGDWRDVDSAGSVYHVSISANCNVTAPQYDLSVWFRAGSRLVRRNLPDGTYGTTITGAPRITANPLSPEEITHNAGGDRLYYDRGQFGQDTLYRVTGCC